MPEVRIATRSSALALTQSRWVATALSSAHPGLVVSLVEVRTTGDAKLGDSLAAIGGKGAFTKELEDALLDGRADLAVHSLKDLPTNLPAGLTLACTPKREATGDVMLLRPGIAGDIWVALPQGAVVGTSSPRRKAQLLARRADLRVVEFRGNVDTRIRKLRQGTADAIILARAGLNRLGLWNEGKIEGLELAGLEAPHWLPAPGQGSLGIEARSDDKAVSAMLAPLHDQPTWHAVSAERAFLNALGAGCTAPVGALATFAGGSVDLAGAVFAADGSRIVRKQGQGTDAIMLGQSLARQVMAEGPELLNFGR